LLFQKKLTVVTAQKMEAFMNCKSQNHVLEKVSIDPAVAGQEIKA